MSKGANYHSAIYTPRTIVDVFICCGQSNSVGGTTPNGIPFNGVIDQNFGGVYSPRDPYIFDNPFKNGSTPTATWGQSSPWPHFAYQWYQDTGRASVWLNLAVAGTPLMKTSIPAGANHWDVTELNKCLLADYTYTPGAETRTRRQMIQDFYDAIAENPRLQIGEKHLTWVQGEADANIGSPDPAGYEVALNNLFDFAKTNYGIQYFSIFGLGHKGDNASQIASWESFSYAAFRNIQSNVANNRADTFFVLNAAKETGPLTVDANYFHISGWDYSVADNVHYTSESYRCMGRTGARNLKLARFG